MDLEEMKSKINEAKSLEELEEIKRSLKAEDEKPEEVKEEPTEEPKEEPVEETKEEPTEEPKEDVVSVEEERSLMRGFDGENKDNLRKINGGLKMEEKKFDLNSKEYRSAWAKKVMGLPEDRFTEDEKRALGDAVTTTATTFVASAADTQGINNGGLNIGVGPQTKLSLRMQTVVILIPLAILSLLTLNSRFVSK